MNEGIEKRNYVMYIRRKRFSYESWFKSIDAEEALPIGAFTKAR